MSAACSARAVTSPSRDPPSNLRSSVDDKQNVRGHIQRHVCLFQDFGRYQSIVIRNNSARIDQAKTLAAIFCLAINAVARDARLVAYNRAALAYNRVKKGGFAYVGASYNHDYGQSSSDAMVS